MSVVAIDLGAGSGRVALGHFDGRRMKVAEVHRFANEPVRLGDRLHWDILRLLHEIEQGLVAAHHAAREPVSTFGIDSWGLDFGLLDAADELVGNPYHYRDPLARQAVARVDALVPRREIWARTGIQFMPFNTLYQLAALARSGSSALARARTLLQIPDLLRFFLTGSRGSEYTNATTTQLVALPSGDWDRELLRRLALPDEILQPIVRPPAAGGTLRPSVREELALPAMEAIIVATHDTASAVAAVPADGDFAYLSCGTWSLLGTELTAPLLDERVFGWNFTNEGGLAGTYRLLQNIAGLWLLDSCRRVWAAAGAPLPLAALADAISSAPPFAALIDPDAAAFLAPSSMPLAIQGWCRETGQEPPVGQGAILRCVHESLALKFRVVFEQLEALTGRRYTGLHLVGGGARNAVLCQFTANALGRPVWAGPVEATALGNIAVQLMASGAIADLAAARRVVRASVPVETYEPRDTALWTAAYERFTRLLAATAREDHAG